MSTFTTAIEAAVIAEARTDHTEPLAMLVLAGFVADAVLAEFV